MCILIFIVLYGYFIRQIIQFVITWTTILLPKESNGLRWIQKSEITNANFILAKRGPSRRKGPFILCHQKLKLSGSGPIRLFKLSASIFAISSGVSSKSKISAFSLIRAGVTDFGIVTTSFCKSQRSTT